MSGQDFTPFNPLKEVGEDVEILLFKTQIRSLFDSYNGEWDILAELIQNAVDAIEKEFCNKASRENPEIEVLVDTQKNIIRVSDNGTGIDSVLAKKILAPNFTDKTFLFNRSKKNFRGHKGVGLTFIGYGSNSLKYCSKTENGMFKGEMNNAKNWVLDDSRTISAPTVNPSDFLPDFLKSHARGSSFEVHVDSSMIPKNLVWEGWEYVIRTQTAAGYFSVENNEEWTKKLKLRLHVIAKDGKEMIPKNGDTLLAFEFLYPHQVRKNSLNLEDYFKKYTEKSSIPITEKHKYDCIYRFWNNKQLLDKFFRESSGEKEKYHIFAKDRNVSAYGVFLHSSNVWTAMDEGLSSDRRRKFWRPGIQIVTKCMPTGRQFDTALVWTAGNKDRFMMIVSMDDTRPDYGRKTFHNDVIDFAQELAEKMINLFVDNKELLRPTAQVRHGGNEAERDWAAEQFIEKAKGLPNLDIKYLNFEKEPQYEQDVVAIFHEMIGRGIIKGYRTLSTSSGGQYDAIVRYELEKEEEGAIYDKSKYPLGLDASRFVQKGENKGFVLYPAKNMEYKFLLSDLIKEFENDLKNFQDIRFAVVWDKGEKKAFEKTEYSLEDVNKSGGEGKREFHGTTHLLYFGSNPKPIHVICLKTVGELLRKMK